MLIQYSRRSSEAPQRYAMASSAASFNSTANSSIWSPNTIGPPKHLTKRIEYSRRRQTASSQPRAILKGTVVHIPDVELDPDRHQHSLPRAIGWRSGLFVPMLRDGAPIGLIVVTRPQPGHFSNSEIELLKTFADQAVIAIENARLFEEVQTRTRELTERTQELTETLEYQTATSEVLSVISRSPTNVKAVFETIAKSAARVCSALNCFV